MKNMAIAIKIVEGNAEPIPNGAIANKNIVPPITPVLYRFLVKSIRPTAICPVAIKETTKDVYKLKKPYINSL